MKHIYFRFSFLALSILCCADNASAQKTPTLFPTWLDSVAYVVGSSIGHNLGDNIKRDSLIFNVDFLVLGFRDALNEQDTLVLTQTQKDSIMNRFQAEMQDRMKVKLSKSAAPNKEISAKWLEENKKNKGVCVLWSGLQYKVLKEGKGDTPGAGDNVTVNYEGRLIDGKIFDSSYERDMPATFNLENVIPGWQEGLMLMKEGGSYELYIPSDLAYGDQGYPPDLPGGAALIFKVELIKVEKVRKK
jgi:FKBP-type peptidyl-prolyl cis-trans isomerase